MGASLPCRRHTTAARATSSSDAADCRILIAAAAEFSSDSLKQGTIGASSESLRLSLTELKPQDRDAETPSEDVSAVERPQIRCVLLTGPAPPLVNRDLI